MRSVCLCLCVDEWSDFLNVWIFCREEKGEKGHHDKEEHEGEYDEEKGHKKKHNDEGGYFDEDKKGKKGKRNICEN